jgi:hypothetical protein
MLELNFGGTQIYNRFREKASAGNTSLTNSIHQLTLSTALNFTKKLVLNSNVIYTDNKYNKINVKEFTIWNTSVIYKMLKDNTIELKLSALDILHQNTGLINYGLNNTLTQGSVNVLKQYFMLSASFFPRKFGK